MSAATPQGVRLYLRALLRALTAFLVILPVVFVLYIAFGALIRGFCFLLILAARAVGTL